MYYYESSGFWVVFRKDTYNEQSLKELGLNDRQVKAVLYVKEKRKITNKEYQEINQISDRTASRELEELTKLFVFKRIGDKKATIYELQHGG